MPPKRTSDSGNARRGNSQVSRGNPRSGASAARAAAATAAATAAEDSESSNLFASSDVEEVEEEPTAAPAEEEQPPEKTIPKDLLTRLLHEFFNKDSTRISKDANAAVNKYFDVFVREAIARTAVEKRGGFLEVDDLEKVTPQLLMDL